MPVPTASAYVDGVAIDDDDTLFGTLVNQIEVSLNADISDSQVSFVVNESITAVNVPVLLIFQTGEIVYCEEKNDVAKSFSSVTRGAGGTVAQAHSAGEFIRLFIAAEHYKQIKSAVIAIETVLGVAPHGSFDDVTDRFNDHAHSNVGSNGVKIATSNLTGHDKTAHDALAINAATLDSYEGATLRELWATNSAKTISSGAFTADGTHSRYVLTSESSTADELTTINGGSTGMIIIVEPASTHTITVAHTDGNIELTGDHDLVLSDVDHKLGLIYDGTDWRILFDSRVSRMVGIPMPVDEGGAVIATGYNYFVAGLPWSMIITNVRWMGEQSGTITLEVYKDSWGTVPTHSTIGADTMSGGGLDDFATGGYYTYYGSTSYKVEIDGTGSPNTFKWSDDGGSTWDATGVSMTGAFQTLNRGVSVKFTATTGHTMGNYWTFTCNSDRIGYEAVSSAQFLNDTTLTNFLVTQLNAGEILELYVPSDATTITAGTMMIMGYKIGD